jgi:hypothetical protein
VARSTRSGKTTSHAKAKIRTGGKRGGAKVTKTNHRGGSKVTKLK